MTNANYLEENRVINASAIQELHQRPSRHTQAHKLTDSELTDEYDNWCRAGNNLMQSKRPQDLRAEMLSRGLIRASEPPTRSLDAVLDDMVGAVREAVTRSSGIKRQQRIRFKEIPLPGSPRRPPNPEEEVRARVKELSRQGFPNLGTEQLQDDCIALVLKARARSLRQLGETRAVFFVTKNGIWQEDVEDNLPSSARPIARVTDGQVTFVTGTRRR